MHEKDTANEEFWSDGVFLRKQLTASSPELFSQKSSITDIWHGSKAWFPSGVNSS